MEIKWTRAATKHRISRERSRHALLNAIVVIEQPAPEHSPQRDDRLVFLGPDPDGELLEVMAVETDAGLLVIHAMRIRRAYLNFLEGADDDRA